MNSTNTMTRLGQSIEQFLCIATSRTPGIDIYVPIRVPKYNHSGELSKKIAEEGRINIDSSITKLPKTVKKEKQTQANNPWYKNGVDIIFANENKKKFGIKIFDSLEDTYSKRIALASESKQAFRMEEELAKQGFTNAAYTIDQRQKMIFALYSKN